uniref:Uncharacterized protein n=1 Tax=Anguilla anguilla TaxID=7936 RepID=A0A0E9S5X2_ANGAN
MIKMGHYKACKGPKGSLNFLILYIKALAISNSHN